MDTSLTIGDIRISRLNCGQFSLDGGAMFGVVPKMLWSKKYPADADNCIRLVSAPLLVRTPTARIIIDTGLGNKLSDKQKKIFRVSQEWRLPAELAAHGLDRGDIDYVILTHCDFDHVGGIMMLNEAGAPELTFPNACHVIQQQEWQDVLAPSLRAGHTYWRVNFTGLAEKDNLMLVAGDHELTRGVRVVHSGGHTRGHQVVRIRSGNEQALHLGDLLPTHLHANPLWIMAYDNFPLDSIEQKQILMKQGVRDRAWFTFYHDPFLTACRFDDQGKVIARWPVETVQTV